jgi:hypothetical protein
MLQGVGAGREQTDPKCLSTGIIGMSKIKSIGMSIKES